MPWCPNCNMEYDEGETVCKGCGLALTEDITETNTFEAESASEDSIEIAVKDETVSDQLLSDEYLSDVSESVEPASDNVVPDEVMSDKIESVETSTDETLIDETAVNQKATDVVNNSEEITDVNTDILSRNEESLDDTEQPEDAQDEYEEPEVEELLTESEEKELANSIKSPVKSSTYIKKEEQYKDLLSSAYSFLVIAILGLGVLVINALGIIHFFNGTLFYFVMGALFIAFLYVGITSFIKAKKVEKDIAKENEVTDAINKWLSENVTEELLDSFVNPEDSEEIQFMHKLEKMKELIISSFGELDDLYLDRLVEEYYNNNLE